MISLPDLWMPIVISAVIVFIASAVIWMASPLHRHDFKDPGDKEETILGMLRSGNFAPGVYYVPWCKGGKDKSPQTMEKMKQGPWAMLTVMPCMPNFGKSLGLWFVHLLIVSTFVAYLASHSLSAAATYLEVFRVTGTAALLAYAGYALPMCIWHAVPWAQLPGKVIDGVIYALLTAGVFGWQWHHAVSKAAPVIPIPK
jgi:hypothetical protein